MKKKTVKKRITIGAIVVVSLAIIYIVPVLAQGVSLRYWRKLGFPNAIQVLKYKIDPYPGHSLECLRFPDKLMGKVKGKKTLEYTERGTGIDINEYHLHVGDSREHVVEEFSYSPLKGTGTRYTLGCFIVMQVTC